MRDNGVAKVDNDKLRGLYSEGGLAKRVLDYFSTRTNNANVTKIDRLMTVMVSQGEPAERRDLIRIMRKIEEAGCGRYVEGRHGHRSRFEWTVESKSVGDAARGAALRVDPLDDDQMELAKETIAGFEAHSYRLRQGLTVRLDLPVDLSPVEAGRLADFIKTLPLTQESS